MGTVTSISLLWIACRERWQESSNFLAADRQISSSQAIPDDFFLSAQSKGLETAQTLVFQSMIYGGNNNQLVSVKAVDEAYPLRGELIVADQPLLMDIRLTVFQHPEKYGWIRDCFLP